jgi:hypothetical protein
MEKEDLIKAAVRETVIVACVLAVTVSVGRFGEYIPGIGREFFSLKLAGMMYLASIVLRLSGFFIRTALSAAFMIAIIGGALVFLRVRYPVIFAFLK